LLGAVTENGESFFLYFPEHVTADQPNILF